MYEIKICFRSGTILTDTATLDDIQYLEKEIGLNKSLVLISGTIISTLNVDYITVSEKTVSEDIERG